MSETQQTTDNEEQPLDLDAIEGRATDLALALAVQTVQRQVLARDVPALVARVRELEAESGRLWEQLGNFARQITRLRIALGKAAGPDAVCEVQRQSVEAGEADFPALGLRAKPYTDDEARLRADAELGALVRRMPAMHLLRRVHKRWAVVSEEHLRWAGERVLGLADTPEGALYAALGEDEEES